MVILRVSEFWDLTLQPILMRVLGLYLSAFGAIPKGFSLTSAIPWLASRDVSGTDISLMRALAVGRVEDIEQILKFMNRWKKY